MASSQQDWQSTKRTVLERSRHMFNNPFMSDVVLTCEGSDKKFFAHKYVLATSSTVFYAMFSGKLTKKNPVVLLSDTNTESLQEFLRFLYTDECKLTTDNAVFVLYLAKKYSVPPLAQKCIELLKANVTVKNVFAILQQAIQFDEKSLENECWDLIDLKTSETVASDGFIHINQVTLIRLLKRETINIKEVDLFDSILKWSEAECLRKGLRSNGKNKRDVLGNAIHEIRFASMTLQEFSQCTSESDLLTPDEMVLFYKKFSGIEKTSKVWNMSYRGASEKEGNLSRCCRFSKYAGHLTSGTTNHAIGISFSKPVKIHGVRFLGEPGSEYEVILEVWSQTTKHRFRAEQDDRGVPGYDVMLQQPVRVQADVGVHIKATVRAPKYYNALGIDGKSTVKVNGITVIFFQIPTHHINCTTVEKGQFDQIIISEY